MFSPMDYVPFGAWAGVLAHTGPLFYHAPLDYRPAIVTVVRRFKNGKLRLRAGDVSFTADAGHLDRFYARPW